MSQTYDVSLNPEKSIIIETEISGGTTDYERLKNLPSINGVELKGDLSGEDLGIVFPDTSDFATKEDLETKADKSEIPDVKEFATKIELEQATINKADKSEIPTKVSAFENDAGYLTEHQDISGLATKDELNDYALKTDIPTKTSDLINDSDFITSEAVKNTVKLLDDEHKETLLLNGTYDGKDVEDGFVFTSPDGKLVGFDKTLNPGGDWYSVTLPTTNPSSSGGPYDGVCCGNGVFVAVNQYLRSSNGKTYSYVATSTNGKDWVEHTNALDWTPSTFTESRSYFKVFFTETRADIRQGLFFMPHEGSGNYLTTSFDGKNWTEVPVTVETQYITDIVYFKNMFILSSKSIGIMIANDGYINWTGVSGVPAGNYKLAVSPNRVVAIKSNEYANQFYYTDDGVNWKSGTLLGNNYYQDIAYGKGKFVITTGTTSYSRDTVLYSEDGVNWNTSTIPSSGGWTNVIYDETTGLFIAVDGMASSDAGAYSEDGVNWTKFTRPQGVINRYGLTSGNGVVVAVPTNPSGSSDLTPRIFHANYTPFYEYGLTDLSFNKAEVIATVQGKTTISELTAQTTLANNVIFRAGEISSVELLIPETIEDDFICEVDFTSGETATAFTMVDTVKWTGDDITDGAFVPVGNKRYNLIFWYDGVGLNAVSRGVE